MQVIRNTKARSLTLGLPRYISELEVRFKDLLLNPKLRTSNSPMVPDVMKLIRTPEKWNAAQRAPADRKVYMSLLGSLMFAMMTCRPDLAFSISFLSQWGTEPKQIHLDALVRVLGYTINTKAAKLVYQGTGGSANPCMYFDMKDEEKAAPQPEVHTDSDWGSETGALSRAGWTAKLGGGAVSWYSKKLHLVALSSAEAEYKALGEGGKEAIWLKQLFTELHLPTGTIKIYCDNQSALAISKNPVQHYQTRHFRLTWHFIRQLQEAGEVEVRFINTNLQDADILTKALSATAHKQAVERLGLYLNQD